jgi:sugar phosphate isomerase/epimerase
MHERLSVNSLCFPGAGWPELAAHWRALSPSRVSFVSALLGDDIETPRRVLSEGGYKLETMTHLFFAGRQLDAPEAVWAEERAKLGKVIEAAAALGGQSIYMMTGGHGAATWEEGAERFSAAVAPCVKQAADAGIKLLIETTSPLYADGHLAHTLRDTVTLAEMSGVGICIDILACYTEAGLKEVIERAMPRCDLIQVSDYVYADRSLPCRAVPGDGNVPLRRILDWILSAGYAGAFDFELIGPRIDAEGHAAAVRRSADYMDALLADLGA